MEGGEWRRRRRRREEEGKGKTAGCVYVPQLWWETCPLCRAKPAHILNGFEKEGHEPQQGRRENNRTALRPALFLGGWRVGRVEMPSLCMDV